MTETSHEQEQYLAKWWQTIDQLLAKFGLKRERLEQEQLCWAGLGIIRCNSISDALHELAHFQVATPERRSLPNYGLGHCPDEYGVDVEATIKNTQDEEELASCLGILWEKKLGCNWKSTYQYHQWNDNARPTFKQTIAKLDNFGLLTKRHLPRARALRS